MSISNDIEGQVSHKDDDARQREDARQGEEPSVQDETEKGTTSAPKVTSTPHHHHYRHHTHHLNENNNKKDQGIPLATSQHLVSGWSEEGC
jgi:hypothetical protein